MNGNRNRIPSHSPHSLLTGPRPATGVSSLSHQPVNPTRSVRSSHAPLRVTAGPPARAPTRTGTGWKLSSTAYQVRDKPGGRLRGCEVISFGMCGKNHGLCNLLFGLCTTVIRGWWHNSHVVVVDSVMRSDFANDKLKSVATTSLIDMAAFREYVLERYGVTLALRDQVRVDVHRARWGNRRKGMMDVTAPFRSRFVLRESSTHLHPHHPHHPHPHHIVSDHQMAGYRGDQGYVVPRGTDLNSLAGDPCSGTEKLLIVELVVSAVWGQEWSFEVRHDEGSVQRQGVDWILRGEGSLPWNFAWINTIDSHKFDDLLEHIPLRMPVGFSLPRVSGKVSVIHVRIEEDYIKHVSANLLKKPAQTYRNALTSAWARNILTHIPRTDTVVVLSYLVHGNPILSFLRQAGYSKVVLLQKRPAMGREVNAVADLIAGVQLCNHVFIGCWSHRHLRGSTFSYVIARHLKARNARAKVVFMDSEQIIKNPTPEILSDVSQLM